MQQRSIVRLGVPLAVTALAVAACGSRSDTSSSTGTSGATKTVKIGVTAPLSGDLSALGKGIQHSVELAAKQANANNTVPGWKIEVVPADDEGKADVGKNAATKLAADNDIIGVVGNLNSSVSQQTQPIFQAARITQVSPANTGPSLTMGADFVNAPKRQYDTFFRTCTTDLVQGAVRGSVPQGPEHHQASRRSTTRRPTARVWWAPSPTTSRRPAARSWQPRRSTPTSRTSTRSCRRSAPSKPQAVFYGGEYPQAGPLSQQMKAAGLNVPLMGGDGIFDPKYIQLAGAAANGDLATSVGAPTDSTEVGKKFLADYQAAGFAEPAAAYGALLVRRRQRDHQGLKTSLSGASDVKSAREATIKAVGKVSFDGVTGKVAFNEFGDTLAKVITAYKVQDGKWVAVKTQTMQ